MQFAWPGKRNEWLQLGRSGCEQEERPAVLTIAPRSQAGQPLLSMSQKAATPQTEHSRSFAASHCNGEQSCPQLEETAEVAREVREGKRQRRQRPKQRRSEDRWEACGPGQRRKCQAVRLPPASSTLWAGCTVLLIAPACGGVSRWKTRRHSRAATGRLDWHELATRTDEVLEAVSDHTPSLAEVEEATRLAKLTGGKVPDVDWTLIADRINKRFKYKPGKDAFFPGHYSTYEDWFLRELSPATRERCLSQAALAEVCSPVQGKAWEQVPSGEMSLKISIIAVSQLLQVLDGKQLVQLRLRWPDYHRVHSPVDGKIAAIDCYQKDELFPGRRRARHSEAKVARPKRTRSLSSGTKVRAASPGQPAKGRRKLLPVPAGSDPATVRKTKVRAKAGVKKIRSSIHPETEKVKKVKRLRRVRGSGPAETRLDQVSTFIEPDACAASACCSSFVQQAEAEEHKTLSTSGTWYFSHSGSEESVTAIVPAETVLASTPAVVHGWCMKWKETASGTKPYLDQASLERTCAHGTAYMLSEPGMTSKEPRGRKVLKKRLLKLKQTARVVCPGSLTERFIACGRASAYSALTAFERRLLSTGQLSWRWLRDEDADMLPPSARRLEADPKAYHQAARSAEGSLPARAVSRLWSVDTALETDALWPLCQERLQLAQRLQRQKGLRRRSDRYMREVLTPLTDQSVLSAAWTDGSSRAALDQARRLVTGCAGAWMAATKQAADAALWKPAWSQMLRRSLNGMYKADEDLTREWSSWLSALRQVQLARLCPGLDLDAQLRLLRAVTLALPPAKAAGDAAAPVVLPLGLFTFWQDCPIEESNHANQDLMVSDARSRHQRRDGARSRKPRQADSNVSPQVQSAGHEKR
eukprot:s171_g19.t4